jgi:MraZ protein
LYFYGTFEHAMDERGRLAIPALYRRAFSDGGGVLRPAVEGCVELYTSEAFEAETERRLSGPDASNRTRTARRARRGFLAEAFPVDLDRQGRILIPSQVREAAGLDSRAVIVGCGEHMELWNVERWFEEKAELQAQEAAE